MWSLTTLGSLRLVDNRSGEEELSGRRKELALLVFLARRAPRRVLRPVLTELLWGDKDEERGRASLRQALSQVRRALGEALETRGDEVALASGAIELDVQRIENDAARGRWSDVAARWKGGFLAGCDDLGGEAYREWLDGERAHLSKLGERAFAAAVEQLEQRGDWSESATLARRWCDAFPDDERAMHALSRAMDRVPPPEAVVVGQSSTNANQDDDVPEPTSRPRRWVTYAVVAVALASLGVAASFTRESTSASSDGKRQTLLVADFRTVGGDSVLGDVVSDALRVGLRQSPVLSVYPPAAVQQAVIVLTHDPTRRADLVMAREIAARNGIKAVVDGQVVGAGDKYQLSARLVATISGEELAHFSADARSSSELLPAVDRLAAQLRRGAGEPLRSIQAARPIERVTTASLEALTKYVRATRAIDLEAAPAKGMALLEEAIALDTTFAMAYRKLAVELDGRQQDARVRELVQHAYVHRARLSDRERYVVEAAYHLFGPAPDEDKAIAAYEAALDIDPTFGVPLNNLTSIYLRRQQFARAESLSARGVRLQTAPLQSHEDLLHAQINLGRLADAARTAAHFDSVMPGNPRAAMAHARLLYAFGRSDSAAAIFSAVFDASDAVHRQYLGALLRDLALVRGNLSDARRWIRLSTEARLRRGLPNARLVGALDDAWITLWHEHDTTAALRATALALHQYRLGDIPPLDRPYGALIGIFSWAGQPARARVALAGYDSATAGNPQSNARPLRPLFLGQIALAERRYRDAIADFRAADSTSCATCLLPLLAIAYDRAGEPGSARALFRRYVDTPEYERFETDATFRGLALRWLARE